jgi:hypothetical protein
MTHISDLLTADQLQHAAIELLGRPVILPLLHMCC